MNNYYLSVSLLVLHHLKPQTLTPPSEGKVSAVYFKNHVMKSLQALFGEVGASIEVDVLKYNVEAQHAILRCPASSYVKLYCSLTLSGNYEGSVCVYQVHQTSPCLLSLLGNSRTYKHREIAST